MIDRFVGGRLHRWEVTQMVGELSDEQKERALKMLRERKTAWEILGFKYSKELCELAEKELSKG